MHRRLGHFHPALPSRTVIGGIDQAEGLHAVGSASHGLASSLNRVDKIIPLTSPGIVRRQEFKDFFFGTAVV